MERETEECLWGGGDMGGTVCKEEVKEEKRRSMGREDSLTSADRIRRITIKQFGYNVLSLARRGLKVGRRLRVRGGYRSFLSDSVETAVCLPPLQLHSAVYTQLIL